MSSVEEAVFKSMQDNKVLAVYSSSGDDLWLNTWFKGGFEQELKKHAIWLRLVQGTEQFTYFEQIFPSVAVPSLYLIQNGQILLIIRDHDDGNSHWAELKKILGMNADSGSTSVNDTAKKTLKEEVIETTQQKYHEELIKQKRSAKQERDRILRLVEADKAERRAQRSTSSVYPTKNPMQIHDNIMNANLLHSKTCTLLIRVTNGDTITKNFDSQSTLNEVRKWVDIVRTDGDCPYSFHRNIPRVTFSDSDELRSLEALELLPRSALILKPLEDAYSNLNVAEAKGPGLLGKVFSGLSAWWTGGRKEELQSTKDEVETSRQLDKEEDVAADSIDLTTENNPSLTTAPRSPMLDDQKIASSPLSSKLESPHQAASDSHIRHNPSELSLPSRCVTPNVYHFVNVEDEDKDRSTYNGNNVNLEKKKDDI